MSQTKRTVIELSNEDYCLAAELARIDGISVENYLEKAVKKIITEESLKNGYAEMAQINLELAQTCFDADEEAIQRYEEELV